MNAPTTKPDTSLSRDLLYALRYYLGNRRALFVIAALGVGAGLALNWSWLAAIGAAPILLALLPCAVMCGLGMCGKHGSDEKNSAGACCRGQTSERGLVPMAAHAEGTPPSPGGKS